MKTAEFPREAVRLLIFELKTPTAQKHAAVSFELFLSINFGLNVT